VAYISVRNWRRFQHYDPSKRNILWIKNYTEILNDDAYRDLSAGCRAVLHGIWLEYASSRCRLRMDSVSITRRLGMKVSRRQLEALNHAGFIDFVASASLADGYQDACLDVEVDKEKDSPLPPHKTRTAYKRLEAFIRNGGYELTDHSLRAEIAQHGVNGSDEISLIELAHELAERRP